MTAKTAPVARCAIDWRAYRLVPSRFPPVGPWDRIASPDDFEALSELVRAVCFGNAKRHFGFDV